MNTVRIIDAETTGLDPEVDRIVEIAAVDWIDGIFSEPWSTLVNPGRDIPSQAKAIHHITEREVENAPFVAAVLADISGKVDICAAHNADFDRKFLPPDFAKYWVCTYKIALRIWPDFPSHSNQFLRYELALPDPTSGLPHRAAYDADVTAHLFAIELTHMTVKQMVQISREPALHTWLNFGKHKGTKFADAPPDYLDWLTRNHEDEGIKFSAAKALEARA